MTFAASGVLPEEGWALDLGSGGGVPGLVLAEALPRLRWVLLDGSARRAAFLVEAVDELGLADRVEVVDARAEIAGHDPAYRARFDAVVVRSFGPPPLVAECAAPFLHVSGSLIVSEPPSTDAVDRWPAEDLAVVGLVPVRTIDHGSRLQILTQRAPCPPRYPRRWPQQRRRPLYVVSRETSAPGDAASDGGRST